MNARELIDSGIIELYVLGIADDADRALVESLAKKDKLVQEEIASVNDALAIYASASAVSVPSSDLKNKILGFIEKSQSELPPMLTPHSTAEEWISYLRKNHISSPKNFKGLYVLELPGNEDYYTYVVWGNKGDIVPDEVHHAHDEFLLICKGDCEMTIDGITSPYKGGDFIAIAPGIAHSALITGDELMLVIGQRRLAA